MVCTPWNNIGIRNTWFKAIGPGMSKHCGGCTLCIGVVNHSLTRNPQDGLPSQYARIRDCICMWIASALLRLNPFDGKRVWGSPMASIDVYARATRSSGRNEKSFCSNCVALCTFYWGAVFRLWFIPVCHRIWHCRAYQWTCEAIRMALNAF